MNTSTGPQTVLITGANRGIGLELCRECIAQGWTVIAVCRSLSAELETLKAGGAIEVHCLNLVDDTELREFAGYLKGRVIDVLINNAGTMGRTNFAGAGMQSGMFGSFDREEWHEVFDINVCTPMLLMELLVENVAASKQGRMVTISSIVSSMELNKSGSFYAYRASKAAVNAIMKSLSIDLADRGIISVAMHPGFVSSDMSGPVADLSPVDSAKGLYQVISALTPGQSGQLIAWDGSVLPW